MKHIWQKRALVSIIDGHKAFLDDIERIVSPSFKPSMKDVLLARVKTTNVTVERYMIGKTKFEMYDVGGQRSEQRKWIDYFNNVNGVIFVAALSEYDQSLRESKRTNRMVETLELFRSVSMNRAFTNTPIILFLNKVDVLKEKLQYSHIADQKPFEDYTGPKNNFKCAVDYFIGKFREQLIENNYKESYIHLCTATDTNNIEFVMDTTQDIVLNENLGYAGLY